LTDLQRPCFLPRLPLFAHYQKIKKRIKNGLPPLAFIISTLDFTVEAKLLEFSLSLRITASREKRKKSVVLQHRVI
jgi:hypothetical protein